MRLAIPFETQNAAPASAVTWFRRIAFATGVSMLLSSQLMFQATVLEHFTIAETLESMGLYFLDILLIALLMTCAIAAIDLRLPDNGMTRNLALAGAVAGSVLAGLVVALVVHYGTGPYPPEGWFFGEAMRWSVIGGAITLIYETIRRHHRHRRQLQEAELRRQVVDNEMIAARLKLLEAQIEPHFLFNTLATVKRLYRTEPVDGARMMNHLKEYLQAALPKMRNQLPTLVTELELVRAYLEILAIRMGDRLSFTVDAPGVIPDTPFPAMTLVTLVENAIKHGLNPMPNGGRISIRVIDSEESIAAEIADDGVGFQAGAGTSGTGIGLANIRARLMALYGSGASLTLLQNEPHGVIARVEISKRAVIPLATAARSNETGADAVTASLRGMPG